MYFNKFPTTEYDFKSIGVQGLEVLDILTRVRFLFGSIFANRAYSVYQLKHGDTPDIIAHNYYGDSDWWWLVLLYNDIVNPFNEIPRLGHDYKSIPGDYPNPSPVVYIERTFGDTYQDFKEDDIIIKLRDVSELHAVTTGGSRKVYYQPHPFEASDSDFATAKIIKWRDSFREATLSDIEGGNFYEGDYVGVLIKENNNIRLSHWGKILLSLPNNTDAIDHFIENNSGRTVHPQFSITERIIKPSGPLFNGGDVTKSTQGTLINSVLGGSGSAGTTYTDNFTAITTKETFDSYSRGSIKLLDKNLKTSALELLNTLLTQRNLTYASFTSTQKKVMGNSNFIKLHGDNNLTGM